MKSTRSLTGHRSVYLGAITSDLLNAAVEDHCFDNEEDNRLLGFGKGSSGSIKCRSYFKDFVQSPANLIPLGIYYHGNPVGICGVDIVSEEHKTGVIHIYIRPEGRKFKVATTALFTLCDTFFKNGGYRLEFYSLRINKRAINFFRHYGFTQESIKKSAYWMDNNVYDTVVLRMLRKDWEKKYDAIS